MPKKTGLVILTFDNANLPEKLKAGYAVITIRKYVSSPIQCKNCHRFGHNAKWCKNIKTCINCCKKIHTDLDKNGKFTSNPFCINCSKKGLLETNNNSKSKLCPSYLRGKEILSIMSDNKISKRKAENMLQNRTPAFVINILNNYFI